MDAVDVSKVLQAKIGGVVDRLIDEVIPEFQPIIDKDPNLGKLSDAERYGVSGLNAATSVVAAVLAKLRGHGCTEEMLDQVLDNARSYEQQNAKAASS